MTLYMYIHSVYVRLVNTYMYMYIHVIYNHVLLLVVWYMHQGSMRYTCSFKHFQSREGIYMYMYMYNHDCIHWYTYMYNVHVQV